VLKLGSHGDGVKALQTTLKRYDPTLVPDGRFGPATERAVRLAQRRCGVFPADGIAGPRTLAGLASARRRTQTARDPSWSDWAASLMSAAGTALRGLEKDVSDFVSAHMPSANDVPRAIRPAVVPARNRAVSATMPAGEVRPVAKMTTSRDGRRFIIAHEAVRGVSNRLHWPGGVSGVTLGPGYDMGTRTPSSVTSDLMTIGVERSVAEAVAAGAGIKGHNAKVFVKANKDLVTIDIHQESALLDRIVPHYESMVKGKIRIPLHQYEFDALVSYAYNPGGGWRSTTTFVNEHKPGAAMEVIARQIKSGPDVVASLVVRRKAESRLFLYGEYK
jgi:GH24 family phage-related lysozyme (muramidase)